MKMMLRLSGSCFLIKELCSILKDQSKLIVVNISKKMNLAVWLHTS